jgi:hypothetical protein
VCGRIGCDKCLFLNSVISQRPVTTGFTGKQIGWDLEGCCSPACERNYWADQIISDPSKILNAPNYFRFIEPVFYEANVRLVVATAGCDAWKLSILSNYMNRPLAQGIVLIDEGHKSLDHGKIIEGLRLCRNDIIYEGVAKNWVDTLADSYVRDLKTFDVPTSKAQIGGITLTITTPQNQKDMILRSCPSCSAAIDQIAVKGQTVKCRFCGSVFQIA